MQRFGLLSLLLYLGRTAHGAKSAIGDSCQHSTVDSKYLGVYNGTCFYFVTQSKLSFPDAVSFCEKLGGTLAMPKSEDVNTFLQQKLSTELGYFNLSTPFWIGLHDRKIEDEYFWEDGSELEWDNFAYYTGGLGGADEDCIAIEPDGLWHDYRCEGFKFFSFNQYAEKRFICEFLPDTNRHVTIAEVGDEREEDNVSTPGEDPAEDDSENDVDDQDDEIDETRSDFTNDATQDIAEKDDNVDVTDESSDTHVDNVDVTDEDSDTQIDDDVGDDTDICGLFVCEDDCFYYGGYRSLPNGCPECKCVKDRR